MKSEWVDYAIVQAHCPGIVWEPNRKQAWTQLAREHSATVISAYWATDPGLQSGISVHDLSSLKKKKKHRQGVNG